MPATQRVNSATPKCARAGTLKYCSNGIEDKHATAEGHGLLHVWMSHGDKVHAKCRVASNSWPQRAIVPHVAGMADEARHFYAVQFHPEVTHTKQGKCDI